MTIVPDLSTKALFAEHSDRTARRNGFPKYALYIGIGVATLYSTQGTVSKYPIEELPSSNWISDSPAHALSVVFSPPVQQAQANVSESTSRLLAEVREQSGLTWDQLARYFGVSRRAVHLWAAGGRMTASNAELLARLSSAISSLGDMEPSSRRQALLRSEAGLNIVDAERAKRSSKDTDINRSPEIGVTLETD
jgi:DNA-binding transcriptional regulator YiaG